MPFMRDLLDRFADEGLDQQRFGFLLVECRATSDRTCRSGSRRAGGGAVAADHVVGEDFQLRLVVGLGFVGEQQRVRHHLGVGLLRVRLDDDLALEHAVALVVEHRLELLAALRNDAAACSISSVCVDMTALAAQQADAADGSLWCLRRQSA